LDCNKASNVSLHDKRKVWLKLSPGKPIMTRVFLVSVEDDATEASAEEDAELDIYIQVSDYF
jgi:hypothetical protein